MQVIQFGLGTMGLPMATTLHAAEVDLIATDTVGEARDTFADAGGQVVAPDAIDVGTASVVITMLPEGEHVRSVVQHILPMLQPGAVLLDCSTIDVLTARELAGAANECGLGFVDAPVSGGPEGAGSGSLSFRWVERRKRSSRSARCSTSWGSARPSLARRVWDRPRRRATT